MAGAGLGKKKSAKPAFKRKISKDQNALHRPPANASTTAHNRRQSLTQLVALAASAAASAHSFLAQNDLSLLPSQTLSLESNLSSVSLSLSNLLSLIHYPLAFAVPRPPPPPPCWFHRLLALSAPDSDRSWVESFRMSRPSFSLLLRLLSPRLSSLSPPISPQYALAAALFRLAHAGSFKSTARRFNLDSSEAACLAFFVVCKAINDNLGHLFEFRSDIGRIIVGFGWISLPNCCGVLGFDSFKVGGNLLGQNGSVRVQALVDSEGRFLDVSAGWPSTMKPDLILRQSALFSSVEDAGELLKGPTFELSDGNVIPQYILGDSCFPLLPWLMTPFAKPKDSPILGPSKQAFNSVHSRGMKLVHLAFAKLRAKWQILSREWKSESIESFPFIILTCCLLHNFLIKCSEEWQDKIMGDDTSSQILPIYEGEDYDESSHRIRDALASHLIK